MKHNSKRIIAALAAAGLLSSGAVFAEYDPNKTIDPSQPLLTTSAKPDGDQLPLAPAPEGETLTPAAPNGATLYSVESKELDGHTIIPLRSVAEGLGFTVEWHEDSQSISLTRGAQYISMAIGSDSYSFSRMAPVSLGMAPTLVDGSTTYVPATLITDIIGGTYSKNEDGTLKIVLPSIVDVKEVNEDKTLLVNDSYLGEVILRITDETVITADGKTASAENIKAGTVLAVEYAQAMTASLPPQVNAVTIDIQNLPTESGDEEDVAQQSMKFSGEIKEIRENGYVLIKNDSDINPEVALIVSDETVITKGNDKRVYKIDDLKAGMEIEGTHSPAMTRSIPPQTVAFEIEIED